MIRVSFSGIGQPSEAAGMDSQNTRGLIWRNLTKGLKR